MKQTYKIFLAAVFGFASLTSCVQEVIEKGAPENDSYGVYFETLTKDQAAISLDPTDDPECTLKVFRTKEDGEIIVPLVFEATDGTQDASSLFTLSELKFEDGQTEAELKISFPDAAIGTTYYCTVSCKDPEYVKLYSQKLTGVSFSALRAKWNLVKGPNGEEFGSWEEDIFAGLFGIPSGCVNDKIQIYEREDKPRFYRIKDVYNPYMTAQFFGGQYPESEFEENCTPGTYSYIDATNPEKVWLPEQETGLILGSDGYINFCSYCEENGFEGAANYGTLENGVIKFPAKGIVVGFSVNTALALGNQSGNTIIIFPGCKDYDYSFSVSYDFCEEGKLPLSFELGSDLAKIKYQFYTGKLPSATLAETADELAKKEDALFVEESADLEIELEETGIYTLIAVGLDADGNTHGYKSYEISYVKADDERPVILNIGIGSAGKYVPKGFSTDNTVEIYAYGEEISDMKIAVVQAADLYANPDKCIKTLKSSKSVADETLKLINSEGYAGPVTGLLPGTEYYLIAYASNGYEYNIFVSEESVLTTGEPLNIYKQFDYTNYVDELEPESEDVFIGTWNLYAVDLKGKTGMREYLGKAVITDSEIEDEGPDEDGYYDEYLTIKGLGGPNCVKNNIDDSYTLDFYAGYLYQMDLSTVDKKIDVLPIAKSDYGAYGLSYLSYFIPVMDGYYAYVSIPKYAASYNFTGLGFYNGNTLVAVYMDYLLVDPSKDENGETPGAEASVSQNTTATISRVIDETVNGAKFPYRSKSDEPQIKLYTPSFDVTGTPESKPVDAKVSAGKSRVKTTAKIGEVKLRDGFNAIL